MRLPATLLSLAVAAGAAGACSNGDTAPAAAPSTTAAAVETTTTTAAAPAVVASPACGATPVVTAGEQDVTMTSGGVERWYVRHVPPAHDGTTPLPLVVDLHGYGEGAWVHVQMSALGPYGDAHGFVTVTPQGQGDPARWDASLGSADTVFIGDLLDQVEQTMCIDENRVYATGLSNGAFMTSVVAYRVYADRFAAVAPVAGIRDIDGCAPARPVPVVTFHGTADEFVAYGGGFGAAVANLPAPDGSGRTMAELGTLDAVPKGPSIPEITAIWAARNGCSTTPTDEAIAEDVTELAYRCPEGAEVELYRVEGGGHAWPGSAFSKQVEAILGRTTDSISADEVMWAFFEAHPLTSG